MNKNEKLIHELFLGKVADEIGFERTLELLAESKQAFNQSVEVKVNNSDLVDVNESTKTCHDRTHSCYPSNYVDGKPNCSNCEYFR